MKTRTIKEIQKKIENGTAVVMTAQELAEAVEDGQSFTFDDIDVVTTATKGLMSGTSAIFSFKVAEKGLFKRALETKMNGIRCFVGPCPNETLGMVDLIVHGTSRSMDNPKYGGGHLFRDLVEGKTIDAYFPPVTLSGADCKSSAYAYCVAVFTPSFVCIYSFFFIHPNVNFSLSGVLNISELRTYGFGS